jgi:molybdopterin-containing oxidoreductase family iron-sulfur binding subunit
VPLLIIPHKQTKSSFFAYKMSKPTEKIYWKGYEELTNDLEFVKNAEVEFSLPDDHTPNSLTLNGGDGSNRRDFLKILGFSVAAVSLAACETPVKHAIPFLNKPEEYDPSIANYYASSFYDGSSYCSVLVKTREGRPIKIEGNTLSSVTKGGTNALAQASVLGLYDINRYRKPQIGGKDATWKEVDDMVSAKLSSGGKTAIVSYSIISPTASRLLSEVAGRFNADVIQYDVVSASGMLEANKENFGIEAIPSYHFNKAKTVVTFGADFLGTWISPIEYAKAFAETRKVGKTKKEMSRLYAVESLMSMTGANADYRLNIRPSEQGSYVVALYNAVAEKMGKSGVGALGKVESKLIGQMADDLVASKGESIVVCNSNEKAVQAVVNALNAMLENYGKTIDFGTPSLVKKGSDKLMNAFIDKLKSGTYSNVVFMGCNPVFDHPRGVEIKEALKSVDLSVSTAYAPDETAEACKVVASGHYFLESWGDCEPKKDVYSLMQPAITPIFDTRQAEESLLVWSGSSTSYFDYLKANWKQNIYPKQKFGYRTFNDFWNYSLHDGVFEVNGKNPRAQAEETAQAPVSLAQSPIYSGDVSSYAGAIESSKGGEGLELVVYEKVGMGIGSQANNPWLMEFPDPVTRACWENYLTIPVSLADKLGIKVTEGKTAVVNLKVGNTTLEIPALVQPGQNKNTVGLAMGFGREVTGKTAKGVGKNAIRLLKSGSDSINYVVASVSVEAVNSSYQVAHVQTHHTVMHRPVIQEATLADFIKDPSAGRYFPKITSLMGEVPATDVNLWYSKDSEKAPSQTATGPNKRPNHQWNMVIDLNTCFGCGACVIACQAENNVPVVGKQEVLNRREMHWIRIDRYYSTDAPVSDLGGSEIPSDDPEVVFQPVMCQHCNNAPCETVCPVLATTHSTEGLNQMTYNRCIGTRYCANNCPYKVRRFNWFSYPQNDKFDFNMNNDLGRMVLNPDVTVRARGVMEKCSLCVQRIQEGKLNAKKEGRRPVDGEIQVACAQACPSDAIVFGDVNDENSRVSQLLAEHGAGKQKEEGAGRAYYMLEEINTRPGVAYLTKIRNKKV